MHSFLTSAEHVAGPRTKLVQALHHVCAALLVVEQRERGKWCQFQSSREFLLDFGVRASRRESTTPDDLHKGCFERGTTEPRNQPTQDIPRQLRGMDKCEGIF